MNDSQIFIENSNNIGISNIRNTGKLASHLGILKGFNVSINDVNYQ
jgi:hypothetical protein